MSRSLKFAHQHIGFNMTMEKATWFYCVHQWHANLKCTDVQTNGINTINNYIDHLNNIFIKLTGISNRKDNDLIK